MNYVPVDGCTNSTNISGTKDAASQEVEKDVYSLRYIVLPNWVHDALLESSSSKAQDDCSTDVTESSGNSNPTATSTNPLADQLETLTVETPISTVSLPVPTACFTDSPEPSIDSDGVEVDVSNMEATITASPTPTLRIHKDHPKIQIIGKFEAKGDEGYFIGYSMYSKEFRVFNKRTKRVEENLHVEFLENKAIEKGAGPNWLFDIDSLTKSMNYVP
nr:retrovirus-related Pol polyprotein from transposon TNT 1-94 [Tanacetum cinerariifolium]